MSSIISANIYKIMKKKKMKQSAVAVAAGYTPRKFNDKLRGRAIIHPADIINICRTLEVEPNDLFKTDETA